jgi:hypothetical protein
MCNTGISKPLVDPSITSGFISINELWHIDKIVISDSKDMAFVSFWAHHVIISDQPLDTLVYYTAICKKIEGETGGVWRLIHVQRSGDCKADEIHVVKTC